MINKKLLFGASAAIVVAILVLWIGLLRNSPLGQNDFFAPVIMLLLLILAWPMKVYVIFASGGANGHWPLPLLVLFLAMSGLFWGILIERAADRLSRRRTAS